MKIQWSGKCGRQGNDAAACLNTLQDGNELLACSKDGCLLSRLLPYLARLFPAQRTAPESER